MKRREFNALIAASVFGPAVHAQSDGDGFSIEGRYHPVTPPQIPETPEGTIEVVECFGYRCPHCYRLLPLMEQYEAGKPEYVHLRHMPVIFRESWEAPARAYYTAELLGVVDQVHRPIFEALHVAGKAMNEVADWRELFVAQGVPAEKFDLTFQSFAVESLLRKSVVMQGRYGVTGTPSIVVNGKYRVAAGLAGSYENIIRITRGLVAKERAAKT
ncbi:MAG: thiol:disulfide interchange protein DsbA/DsbL [Gammaproteobacteria bacterium]|nr:thiol:disulfide interchange protein DsbA/DsbL [Gammaproteobacteria bacterium]